MFKQTDDNTGGAAAPASFGGQTLSQSNGNNSGSMGAGAETLQSWLAAQRRASTARADLADLVLRASAIGASTVALTPDRTPLKGTTHRVHQQTADDTCSPTPAQLGRSAGVGLLISSGVTRIAVLDVDIEPDLDPMLLHRLVSEAVDVLAGGVAPGVVTVTPSGGAHFWYRVADDESWHRNGADAAPGRRPVGALNRGKVWIPAWMPRRADGKPLGHVEVKVGNGYVPMPWSRRGDRYYAPDRDDYDLSALPLLPSAAVVAAARRGELGSHTGNNRGGLARVSGGNAARARILKHVNMLEVEHRTCRGWADLEDVAARLRATDAPKSLSVRCPFGCDYKAKPSAWAAPSKSPDHLYVGCSRCGEQGIMPIRDLAPTKQAPWPMPVERKTGARVGRALGWLDEEIPVGSGMILAAPMGSGKSHWYLRDAYAAGLNPLIVIPGEKAARALGARTGFRTYKDGPPLPGHPFIVTPDSLPKVLDHYRGHGIDLLVVDEADQVTRAMFADYHLPVRGCGAARINEGGCHLVVGRYQSRSEEIHAALDEAAQLAGRVLVTSGTLSRHDVTEWQEVLSRSGKHVRAVQLDAKLDRELLVATKRQADVHIDEALRRGEAVAIATTMSPNQINTYLMQLLERHPKKRVFSAHSGDDDEVVEHLLKRLVSADRLADICDVFVYSPVVRSSVDIQAAVDHVVLLHSTLPIPAADVLQMPMRFRNPARKQIVCAVYGRQPRTKVVAFGTRASTGAYKRTAGRFVELLDRTAADHVGALREAAEDAHFETVRWASDDDLAAAANREAEVDPATTVSLNENAPTHDNAGRELPTGLSAARAGSLKLERVPTDGPRVGLRGRTGRWPPVQRS